MTATALSELRVLVVDDDAFLLDIIGKMLALLEIDDVTLVDKAADALNRVAAGGDGIDVILCDINMPDMDGFEFIEKLGKSGFGGALAIMSGNAPIVNVAESFSEAKGIRVLGSLFKPFGAKQLEELLSRCLAAEQGGNSAAC